MHMCARVCICVYICACVRACIFVCTFVCLCVCGIYECICVFVYVELGCFGSMRLISTCQNGIPYAGCWQMLKIMRIDFRYGW